MKTDWEVGRSGLKAGKRGGEEGEMVVEMDEGAGGMATEERAMPLEEATVVVMVVVKVGVVKEMVVQVVKMKLTAVRPSPSNCPVRMGLPR